MKVGDLVASAKSPTAVYRVISAPAKNVVRILPYERQGREVLLLRIGSRWVDGETAWSKV